MMSYNGTGPLESPRRILVVRLGSMGDIIHALPAVARLKCGFPQAEVTWAIEPRWAPLLKENPFVDRVFPIPLSEWRSRPFARETRGEFRRARKRLRESRFDLAVDFQGLLKSAMVTYFSRAERVFGFHRGDLREPIAAAFYSDRVETQATHVVEKNLELVSATGVKAVGARDNPLVFPLPAGEPEPSLPEGDFVLASPVAGWRSKQWPADYFAALAGLIWRHAGMPLVIDCAPAEAPHGRRILDSAPAGSCRLHISPLEGLIAATRRACAVVGVDSGPLHLAAALERPGVAIFGPTDPARNGPHGKTLAVLRAPQAATSYKRGQQSDSLMAAVRPEQVWEALKEQLSPEKAPRARFAAKPQ